MTRRQPRPRFMMWVDGVGGYLVCMSDEIVIGQAIDQPGADLPIIGDISRRHAVIQRQGESYLIRAEASTRVAGREVTEVRTLTDGDEIEFGASFRVRFRQPHPLSATSRLDFLSGHRSQPASDGMLLMANSCILGPGPNSHVVCRAWSEDLVLVRQGQQLRCHGRQMLEIDGQEVGRKGEITLDSRITGEDFCLSLERFD
ncbi:MAG: FHA domain-containing protein [Pirellulaceae bacterium]|nr:FHA domain-containing protein [Pirellulaceae bacterium]